MIEALLVLAVGLVAAVVGGAIGGLLTGAKVIGPQLAALMGVFFGPMAGFVGVALGLSIWRILS